MTISLQQLEFVPLIRAGLTVYYIDTIFCNQFMLLSKHIHISKQNHLGYTFAVQDLNNDCCDTR